LPRTKFTRVPVARWKGSATQVRTLSAKVPPKMATFSSCARAGSAAEPTNSPAAVAAAARL